MDTAETALEAVVDSVAELMRQLAEERAARHAAEAKLTEAHLMLAEIRDELTPDMDVVDGPEGGPQPNKAMRLCQWMDEVLPKRASDVCGWCGTPYKGAGSHARCVEGGR